MNVFRSRELHSSTDMAEELMGMCDDTCLMFTLGNYVQLSVYGSPLVTGGPVSEQDIDAAFAVMRGARLIGRENLVHAVRHGMELARRAFKLFPSPSADADGDDDEGDGKFMTPEWLVDLFGLCCRLNHALTWHDFLWGIPLVAIAHMAAGALRMSGQETPRPEDFSEAFAALKDLR